MSIIIITTGRTRLRGCVSQDQMASEWWSQDSNLNLYDSGTLHYTASYRELYTNPSQLSSIHHDQSKPFTEFIFRKSRGEGSPLLWISTMFIVFTI